MAHPATFQQLLHSVLPVHLWFCTQVCVSPCLFLFVREMSAEVEFRGKAQRQVNQVQGQGFVLV